MLTDHDISREAKELIAQFGFCEAYAIASNRLKVSNDLADRYAAFQVWNLVSHLIAIHYMEENGWVLKKRDDESEVWEQNLSQKQNT